MAIAGCGDDDDDGAAGSSPAAAASATRSASAAASPSAKGTVLVGDVLAHSLSDSRWKGEFGFVTFKLHAGVVDGQPAYFIRTDASDEAFAKSEKLVFVSLMAKAASAGKGIADLFVFTNGQPNQPAVLATAPHKSDYTPAFRLNRVTFTGQPEGLDSAAAVLAASNGGRVKVERTNIVVNYPVVKWPGGELPVDNEKTAYLGSGQLIEPVDVAGGKVTFKLHACYPASRYIVTDVSLPPMADGMKIAPAPGAAALSEAGATAKILVFENGVKGSGPMGFQKSVMDSVAGDAKWSPYWDHFTFTWNDESKATVVKSESSVLQAESGGGLKRFPGTPDTKGTLFMVNCPVPVLAAIA